MVAPLLATCALEAPTPDLEGVAAIAFTSAAGVRAFAALTPNRDRPVFAVGAATAAAARAAGFAEVRDADGSARDLAVLIAEARPPGRVLAPGAREPAFDLPAALGMAGVAAEALPVYATVPVRPAPRRVLALLSAGRLDAVLLQSGAAARALEVAVSTLGPTRPPLVLALSPACLPTTLSWPSRTAATPRTRDLLALLARPRRRCRDTSARSCAVPSRRSPPGRQPSSRSILRASIA